MEEKSNGFELMEPASPEALVPDYGLWPWFAGAAVLALIVILAIFLIRKRKPAIPNLASLRKAALAEATSALKGLGAGSARETAVLASFILRKYLSAAAGDPALFETHEEFISRQDSLRALTPEARAAAEAGFTRLAALKYTPEIPETESARVVADSQALLETLHQGFTT